jgi:hypothetical protein
MTFHRALNPHTLRKYNAYQTLYYYYYIIIIIIIIIISAGSDYNGLTQNHPVQSVLTDSHGHFWVTLLVNVDVADAFTVAQDRDLLAVGLNLLHQLLGATRDDQVNVVIHLQQVRDVLTTAHLYTKMKNM